MLLLLITPVADPGRAKDAIGLLARKIISGGGTDFMLVVPPVNLQNPLLLTLFKFHSYYAYFDIDLFTTLGVGFI